MTALVQTLRNQIAIDNTASRSLVGRAAALAVLAAVAVAVPGGIELAGHAIADAYLAVSVFVAATILVLYAAEGLFKADLGAVLARHQRWQVPAGALLGALPGCGGAIVAVTQFTRGTLSFGGVVATLTSTMGDAMFILLAREPQTAGLVFVIGMIAGIVTGYVVDAIHGPRFMQPDSAAVGNGPRARWFDGSTTKGEMLWFALLVPGLAIGVADAFQVEFDSAMVEAGATAIGIVGGLLAVGMWLTRGGESRDCLSGDGATAACRIVPQGRKVVDDTNFVTAWVVFAFVAYELLVSASGVDLGAAFGVWAAAVPAAAIAIGFIPGCGPQIVTTSLYLDGAIPLSAQLGNAISNDGDALFPAIAKAPKAAALATLYTTVPAIIVAYGAYAMGY